MTTKNDLFFNANNVPLKYRGTWNPLSGALPNTTTFQNGSLLKASSSGTISGTYYKIGSFIYNNNGTWDVLTSYNYNDLINRPTLGTASELNATTAGQLFITLTNNSVEQQTARSYLGFTTLGSNIATANNSAAVLSLIGLPTDIVEQLNAKQPIDGDLTAIAAITGTGLLRRTGVNTWVTDTATYLTQNQNITVSGDATGTGSTNIVLTLSNSGITPDNYLGFSVNSKGLITGYTPVTTLSGYGITDAAPLTHVGSNGVSQHAVADASNAGFMSSTHFTKLENIQENATENSSDAFLLDRANHEGTQAQSTVTNLVSDLATKQTIANLVQDLTAPSVNTYISTLGLVEELADIVAGEVYEGEWDSSTNTPTIVSSTGTEGQYYVISVGSTGVTTIDGRDDWPLGGSIIFRDGVWKYKPSFNTVTSVQGQTGAVVLDKADIDLDQVDNTADADKPISTAQQSALDLKENLSNKVQNLNTLSATSYPSVTAVRSYLQNNIKLSSGSTVSGVVIYSGLNSNSEPTVSVSQPLLDGAFTATNSSDTDTTSNISMKRGYLGIGSLNRSSLPSFSTFNDVPRINGLTAQVLFDAVDRPFDNGTNPFTVKVSLVSGTSNTWKQSVDSTTNNYYRIETSGWSSWYKKFDSRNTIDLGLTQASAVAALGLGDALNYDVVESNFDITPDRLLTTGYAGLLQNAALNNVAATDLNDRKTFALTLVSNVATNRPSWATSGSFANLTLPINSSNGLQLFFGQSNLYPNRISVRQYSADGFTAPVDLYHTGNLIKTLSNIDVNPDRILKTGDAGILGTIDLRSAGFVPQDLYGKGVIHGYSTGGSLGIPGFNSSAFGTLIYYGSYPTGAALNSINRVFIYADRKFISFATSATTWSTWQEFYSSNNVGTIAKNLFSATTAAQAQTALLFGTSVLTNASVANTSNNVVQRDASGNINVGTVVTNISEDTSSTISHFYVAASANNNIRKVTPARARDGLQLGNASLATLPSVALATNDFAVSKYLRWNNGNGNNRIIFDASSGLDPVGGAIGSDPAVAWSSNTYPNLMGWNGTQTYGVRVDRAKTAENALTLNGQSNSSSATNNTVVSRDSSGRIFAAAFNTTVNAVTSGVTNFFAETGSDGYIRKISPANARTQLSAANISGDTFTGKVSINFNGVAQPIYSTGQLELRDNGSGNPVVLGFHRQGATACSLMHVSNGLILTGTSFSSRANFECANLTVQNINSTGTVSGTHSGNGAALTNLNASNLSTGTVPVARLSAATTSAVGIVQLSNATNSTSQSLAATANAVKLVNDTATAAASSASTALTTANTANTTANNAATLAGTANTTANNVNTALTNQTRAPKQKFLNAGNISGTFTLNISTQATHVLGTVTGNLTLAFTTTGLAADEVIAISFELNNVGNFTLTLPAGTRLSGATPPTFATNSTGVFVMTKAGTNNWRLYVSDGDNR